MPIKICGMKLLIHSQTATVQPLQFGIDQQFYPTLPIPKLNGATRHPKLYCASDYFSIMILKIVKGP